MASATATRTGSSHYTRHRRHRTRHSVRRGFTTSVVLTRLNLAQGDWLVGVPQVVAWAMACDPFTSSEIAGRELGERTCLHVRPGRITMLECRFNKTTHHQTVSVDIRSDKRTVLLLVSRGISEGFHHFVFCEDLLRLLLSVLV